MPQVFVWQPSPLEGSPSPSDFKGAAMNTRNPRFAIGLVLAIIMAAGGLMLADPTSPMTISDVDSPDPVASGAQLTYTITMVNTAGSKVTNVVMTDQLNGVGGIGVPPQLQITSTRGSCSQST